jgi:GT2 family glycosyltransferase
MTPDLQIILMVYKSRQVLGQFLESVGSKLPVILVDNSYHEDDISDLLVGYPNVTRIDSGGNVGFSAAANTGAKAAKAPFLVFMNPDTRPEAASLLLLVDYLKANPDVAACGAAGRSTAGGGAQPTARRILAHALGWHRRSPLSAVFYQDLGGNRVDVEWISGSCLAIRRDVYERVGGFDPDYFIYMSDFDLGRRLQNAGYRQVVLGDVVVAHDDGGSSDLPSLWTWERRGRAWTRFLRRTRPLPVAFGLSLSLIVGYAARAIAYTATGRRTKAHELGAYLRAVIQEWIRPSIEGPRA